MKKDINVFLGHILENIGFVEGNIKDVSFDAFQKSKMMQDAVVREIEIIGEAVKNIPMDFREQHPEIPWKKIAGMRDEIVHEYFDIDLEIVWKTIKEDLPKLKSQVESLV